MLGLESQSINWWLAATGFFTCKIAVPLFVMVSGSLLLGRIDDYRKHARRIARMAIALVVFSVFYYLTSSDTWSLTDFAQKFWHAKISGHLWYLYMYIGLLMMLPLLQKMAAGMSRKDYIYFLAIGFGVVNLVPVFAKFNSSFAYASDFSLPLFGGYLCMFVCGHFLAHIITPTGKQKIIACVVFLACLAFLVLATNHFYDLNDGNDYLQMQNRTFTPIMLMAACVFVLIRPLETSTNKRIRKNVGIRITSEIAMCSFGVYLIHMYFVRLLNPYFSRMCTIMPDITALLSYQITVFLISFAITWLFRLIPPVRKII